MKCNLNKIQCIVPTECDASLSQKLEIIKMQRRGKLLTMTVRGREEEVLSVLQEYNPIYCEAIPLTLEEIFISETEVVGYDMQKLIQ